MRKYNTESRSAHPPSQSQCSGKHEDRHCPLPLGMNPIDEANIWEPQQFLAASKMCHTNPYPESSQHAVLSGGLAQG